MAKTLTIGDLLQIDPGRVKRSKDLKVVLDGQFNILKEENILQKVLRFLKLRKGKLFYIVFKYKVYSNSGRVYTVFLKVSPQFDEKKFLKNKVQVFCNCSDFMYRVAYELNKADNVFLNKETREFLGDAIKIPPTKVVTSNLCKHVYAVIEEFEKQVDKLIIK